VITWVQFVLQRLRRLLHCLVVCNHEAAAPACPASAANCCLAHGVVNHCREWTVTMQRLLPWLLFPPQHAEHHGRGWTVTMTPCFGDIVMVVRVSSGSCPGTRRSVWCWYSRISAICGAGGTGACR
jgi:hypothetical protein